MPAPDRNDHPDRPARKDIAADPEALGRVGRAYAELLAVVLAAVAGLSALILWHLARRGRLLRDRFGSPRSVRWPEELAEDDGRDRIENQS